MTLLRFVLPLLLLVATAGCSVAQPTPSDARTSAPSSGAEEGTGTIEGEVSYGSDHRPDLDVYAIDVDDPEHWYKVTVAGSPAGADHQPLAGYSIDVAPGTYFVLAYLTDRSDDFAGLHSEAVPCGLTGACTDHAMRPVTVAAGETLSGIDTTDWYYGTAHDCPPRPD